MEAEDSNKPIEQNPNLEKKFYRHKGRFVTKKKIKQLENIRKAHARRRENNRKPTCSVFDGRRIVDINFLGEQMWCKNCNLPLSFRQIVQEETFDLASTFHVQCQKCYNVYEVHSSAFNGKNSKRTYHINSEAALAMKACGVSESDLNMILSTLSIPPANQLLETYERLVGSSKENVAKNKC